MTTTIEIRVGTKNYFDKNYFMLMHIPYLCDDATYQNTIPPLSYPAYTAVNRRQLAAHYQTIDTRAAQSEPSTCRWRRHRTMLSSPAVRPVCRRRSSGHCLRALPPLL